MRERIQNAVECERNMRKRYWHKISMPLHRSMIDEWKVLFRQSRVYQIGEGRKRYFEINEHRLR